MVWVNRVGRVVPVEVPPRLDGGAIEKLLDSAGFEDLAARTRDPRLSDHGWSQLLRYELAMLVHWLAHRELAYHRADAPAAAAPAAVATLLPHYGFALHALRRSIPFAALGITTSVTVPTESLGAARAAIDPLLGALELAELVSLTDQPPPTVVKQAVGEGVPIYLTGRLATWRQLTEEHPGASIVGATGDCAVILSDDRAAAEALAARLAERALPISCTNHMLTLLTSEALAEASAVTASIGPFGIAAPGTVGEEIQRVHPSVVLIPHDGEGAYDSTIAGYRMVSCTLDGVANSTFGFGLDPVAGWPGDHCV